MFANERVEHRVCEGYRGDWTCMAGVALAGPTNKDAKVNEWGEFLRRVGVGKSVPFWKKIFVNLRIAA